MIDMIELIISVVWETFKSNLGLPNTSIVYVDEEGREIPIDTTDVEFQEALRLAKLNNNHLKLRFLAEKVPKNLTVHKASPKCKPDTVVSSTFEKLAPSMDNVAKSSVAFHSDSKQNICHCNGDAPPEWFTNYMKKFKEDLLHELKASICDSVDYEMPEKKFTIGELCGFKNESSTTSSTHSYGSSTIPSKKKKKSLGEGYVEFPYRGRLKLSEKLDDMGDKAKKPAKAERTERLEKLENKTRFSIKEKKRLTEKKSSLKSESETMEVGVSDNKNTAKKSACFREQGIVLLLAPGGEFNVNVNIINDGKVPWCAPRLECCERVGLHINEPRIELPKLLPMETCMATIRGKATKTVGPHHFGFMFLDGEEKIGPKFTCLVRVDLFEPFEEYPKLSNRSASNFPTVQPRESGGSFINYETDLIANSEKKIEENIIEIEKRLKLIDLLHPSSSSGALLKNNEENLKTTTARKMEEVQTLDCDLLQNSNERETNWKGRLEQEEVLIGFDCLRFTADSSESPEKRENSAEDEDVKNKDDGLETTDSDLSVVCMSEEDETFIVVPLPSKSSSSSDQFFNEDKRVLNGNSEIRLFESEGPPESDAEMAKPDVSKTETKDESMEHTKAEVNATEDFHSGQLTPTRTRRSPFSEEISEFRPKKMKSKSTEYYFTAANLTQPTFCPIPEGIFERKYSKFNFSGEKKEKPQTEERLEGRPSRFTFTGEKEEKPKSEENFAERNIRKADALGRVIYAVNTNGYCLPVGDLFNNGDHSRSPPGNSHRKEGPESETRSGKQNDRFNEILAVNILPNAFMSGASSVASLAFNTAKSVINNLQSAFVTEGKTELGKPAYEDKKKLSMEAMFRLHEMGFSDLNLNKKLLLNNDNDLLKVVEELVLLAENSSRQPQKFHKNDRQMF